MTGATPDLPASRSAPTQADSARAVPPYHELPVLPTTNERHAWDVWGRQDSLGSVNRLTPDRVLAGVSSSGRARS